MTVKQLTEVVNGRLKPSTAVLDADILEVSKEQGNALQVKEDGLYYKESIVVDEDSALNVVSGKLTVVVSPVGDNILQKTTEGLYVPTQGNPHNITTSDINEGTNLFFTESRVNQTVLTGLDTSTATPVLDTDQILAAIGKLQAQINNIISGGGTASYPSFTGNAGKVLTVNATEDGVEWVTISNGDNPPDADDESILELQEGTFITISGGTLTFANGSSTVFTPGTSTTYSVTAAQVGKANFKNTSANYVARGTSLVKVLHYPRNATTISHENSPNLIEVPAHLPSDVTVLTSTFNGCSSFNHPNISKWDTSNVTSMASMFYGCSVFNQPLNDWNTTNVTDMYNMFWLCIAFNQPLDNWDTSSVTTMRGMFSNCTLFNQSLNTWNTSNVTSMVAMFSNCTNFNQGVGNWDTSKVTSMNFMFLGCSSFDQPIGKWNVSKVIAMNSMFYKCTNFNQDISSWCVPFIVSKPTNFSSGTNLPLAYEPVWGTCPTP